MFRAKRGRYLVLIDGRATPQEDGAQARRRCTQEAAEGPHRAGEGGHDNVLECFLSPQEGLRV